VFVLCEGSVQLQQSIALSSLRQLLMWWLAIGSSLHRETMRLDW